MDDMAIAWSPNERPSSKRQAIEDYSILTAYLVRKLNGRTSQRKAGEGLKTL